MSRPAAVALLLVATWLTYANALTAPFSTWDDPLYVTSNARVQDSSREGLATLWSAADAYGGRYIEFFPLRDTVYWAIYKAWGPRPLPFHAANVVVHSIAVLLVWVLARRLGLTPFTALAAGLLFAVHPIHIESVTWIAGLKDPLYLSFMIGSLLAWDASRRGRPWAYVLCLVLLVLALLCKSLALVAPGLFLAWELRAVTPWTRERVVRLAAELTPPVLVVVLFTLQFMAIGRANHVIQSWHGGTVLNHAFVSGWAFALYLAKSVAPFSFRLHYCFELPSGPLDPRLLAAVLVGPTYLAALAWSFRRHRLAFFLLCWFVISLFPVMNVVPFPAIFADRYAYAPSVASCGALALACGRLRPALGRVVLGSLVIVLAAVVIARNQAWHHESTLWREVMEDRACRDAPVPPLKLADAYLREKRWADAAIAYRRAMDHPAHAGMPAETRAGAHMSMARAARHLGALDVAEAHARAALALYPGYDDAWAELWQAQWWGGDVRGALATAEQAVARDPGSPYNRWGRALLRLELEADAGAAAEAARILERWPVYCPSLDGWRQAHPPGHPARAAMDAAGAGRSCP